MDGADIQALIFNMLISMETVRWITSVTILKDNTGSDSLMEMDHGKI